MSEGYAHMESRLRVWTLETSCGTVNRCGIAGMCDVWINVIKHVPIGMCGHSVVVKLVTHQRVPAMCGNLVWCGVGATEWVQLSHTECDRWTTKTSSTCDMMCVARVVKLINNKMIHAWHKLIGELHHVDLMILTQAAALGTSPA